MTVITPELAREIPYAPDSGLVVCGILPNMPSEVRRGDLLVKLNASNINSAASLAMACVTSIYNDVADAAFITPLAIRGKHCLARQLVKLSVRRQDAGTWRADTGNHDSSGALPIPEKPFLLRPRIPDTHPEESSGRRGAYLTFQTAGRSRCLSLGKSTSRPFLRHARNGSGIFLFRASVPRLLPPVRRRRSG